MRRPRPGPDAMAAALEAVQRLAAEADAEDAARGLSAGASPGSSSPGSESPGSCRVCGYRNREGNKFCAMCGLPADGFDGGLDERLPHELTQGGNMSAPPFSPPPHREREAQLRPGAGSPETHHYHHHYHHHYFPAGQESGGAGRPAAQDFREPEKRQMSVLRGESMSRAEAAVRRITQEWVLACNTKHLDDLLDLYVSDAMVMRSNYPASFSLALSMPGWGKWKWNRSGWKWRATWLTKLGAARLWCRARPGSGVRSGGNIFGCWRGRVMASGRLLPTAGRVI